MSRGFPDWRRGNLTSASFTTLLQHQHYDGAISPADSYVYTVRCCWHLSPALYSMSKQRAAKSAVNMHHLDTTLRLDIAALITKELVFTHASKINKSTLDRTDHWRE